MNLSRPWDPWEYAFMSLSPLIHRIRLKKSALESSDIRPYESDPLDSWGSGGGFGFLYQRIRIWGENFYICPIQDNGSKTENLKIRPFWIFVNRKFGLWFQQHEKPQKKKFQKIWCKDHMYMPTWDNSEGFSKNVKDFIENTSMFWILKK